jgi:hypothetical protein
MTSDRETPLAMRYYSKVDEGSESVEGGGDPTYYLEVNDRGDAEREVIIYPNSLVRVYDRDHTKDEYGALAVMVVDGDDDWWEPYSIMREEFEDVWRTHAGTLGS